MRATSRAMTGALRRTTSLAPISLRPSASPLFAVGPAAARRLSADATSAATMAPPPTKIGDAPQPKATEGQGSVSTASCVKVTAATFDTEVLQSQQAMCVVFHVANSQACRAFLPAMEQAADKINEESAARWLKVATVDADHNANLASAFSVERAALPVTYFVAQGTIVDKVSRHVPPAKLAAILHRFRDYHEKQRGVELADHGPVRVAERENLTEVATTQVLESKLVDMLSGEGMVPQGAVDQIKAEVIPVLRAAEKQAGKDIQTLRKATGMDVKKLTETQMNERFYSQPQYTAAAHVAALTALVACRCIDTFDSDAFRTAQQRLVAAQKHYPQSQSTPSVRKAVALCDTILLQVQALDALVRFEKAQRAWTGSKLAEEEDSAAAVAAAASTSTDAASTTGGGGDFLKSKSDLLTQRDAPRATAVKTYTDALDAVLTTTKTIVALTEQLDSRDAVVALPADLCETLVEVQRSLLTANRVVVQAKERATATNPELARSAVIAGADVKWVREAARRAVVNGFAMYPDDKTTVRLRQRLAGMMH